MELESNLELAPSSNKKVKLVVVATASVSEPRIYIQQWATERLDRSIGQLESLGAYMDQETRSGHEYDTSSRFEKGYLEFYRRPVLA